MLSQQELNAEMIAAAKRAATKARAFGIATERELISKPVRRLLSGAIDRFAVCIREWVEGAKHRAGALHSSVVLLKRINPEMAASLAGAVIMNSISSHKPMTNLCVKIGEAVEDEIRMAKYRKEKGSAAKATIERLNKTKKGYDFRRRCARYLMRKDGIRLAYWSKSQRLRVGVVLLNLFIQATGLVKINKRWESKTKCTNIVVATDACLEWINNYMEAKEVLLPRFLPMSERPRAWGKDRFYGGGYGPDVFEYPLVKCRSNKQKETMSKLDMPVVFACANNLQAVPWKINQWVYSKMRDFWDRGLDDGGLIPMNHVLPLPRRPSSGTPRKNKAWDDYNKQATLAYSMNVRMKTKRIAIGQTIYTAQKMLELDRFYFPVQFDFRGRCYYVPSHLNPQGSDYSRALLEFAESEPLTQDGLRWFKIFGANLFGNNKVSHAERVEWVDANLRKIQACGQDPYNCKWWQDAKEKWQFLRWCREYTLYLDDPSHPVGVPVTMDCTSSGLQVLSLLTRDLTSATMTNLTDSQTPKDVYELVKNKFVENLKQNENSHVARLWLQMSPDRTLTKPSVMTIPYGGTRYSIQKSAQEWIKWRAANLKIEIQPKQIWEMVVYYASSMDKIVRELFPKPVLCMEWLQQTTKLFSCTSRGISWTAPSGFFVSQPYMKTKAKKIKTSLAGTFSFFTLLEDSKTKVDSEKQISTVGPNFIHSLDASIVHLLFSKFKFSSVAIHDCYGTQANHVSSLLALAREQFVLVFKNNNLDLFYDSIRTSNVDISGSSSFQLGSFDPCNVMTATYTFG